MPKAIQIRDATIGDSKKVWEINSHPSVRAQSINATAIPWETHEIWFEQQLKRDDSVLKVVLADGVVGGIVRFELLPDALDAIISTALAPRFRGMGIGRHILETASKQLLQQSNYRRIIAYIRPANTASIKAFEFVGYKFIRPAQKAGVDLYEYHLKDSDVL